MSTNNQDRVPSGAPTSAVRMLVLVMFK